MENVDKVEQESRQFIQDNFENIREYAIRTVLEEVLEKDESDWWQGVDKNFGKPSVEGKSESGTMMLDCIADINIWFDEEKQCYNGAVYPMQTVPATGEGIQTNALTWAYLFKGNENDSGIERVRVCSFE